MAQFGIGPSTNKKKLCKKKKYDKKLSRDGYLTAISKICDKMGLTEMWGMLPTIDCFASKKNYLSICNRYITKKNNFFSSKYDNISDWSNEVAWCNPPYEKKIIIKVVELFEKRKIRGYVCTRYYTSDHSTYTSQNWLWQIQERKCKYYVNIGRKKGIWRVPFAYYYDVLVLYFDFQD